MTTIFTKIINEELPSYKIYEDDYVCAFLDIKPHTVGHTLVVPKMEVGYITDLEEPYYSALFGVVKTIGKAVHKATQCQRVGIMVHGMGVPEHVHVHLIPLFRPDDIDMNKARERSKEEMEDIHRRIVAQL